MNSTIPRLDRLAQLLLVESVAPVASIPDPIRSTPETTQFTQFRQGQKYQATVVAHLPNGNFKVLIGEQLLQINLSESNFAANDSVRLTDKLELVLIAHEPRLKFVLLDEARQKTGTGSSLSPTGRFLGALLHDANKSSSSAAAIPVSTLTSPTPLLLAPPANGRLLPELLRQTLSQSGLFYESHQAQWIAGKNTLQQLQQEPQGRLPTVVTAAILPDIQATLQRPDLGPENGIVSARAAQELVAPAHAQSLTLVLQQLAVLETGQLNWRGEIWPGLWVEWNIAERPPAEDKAGNETDQATRWQTRLHLTLPKLGEVAAMLALDSRGVHITLGAMATDTAALLQSNRQPLTAAMAAVGLSVLTVEVEAQYNV